MVKKVTVSKRRMYIGRIIIVLFFALLVAYVGYLKYDYSNKIEGLRSEVERSIDSVYNEMILQQELIQKSLSDLNTQINNLNMLIDSKLNSSKSTKKGN